MQSTGSFTRQINGHRIGYSGSYFLAKVCLKHRQIDGGRRNKMVIELWN